MHVRWVMGFFPNMRAQNSDGHHSVIGNNSSLDVAFTTRALRASRTTTACVPVVLYTGIDD